MTHRPESVHAALGASVWVSDLTDPSLMHCMQHTELVWHVHVEPTLDQPRRLALGSDRAHRPTLLGWTWHAVHSTGNGSGTCAEACNTLPDQPGMLALRQSGLGRKTSSMHCSQHAGLIRHGRFMQHRPSASSTRTPVWCCPCQAGPVCWCVCGQFVDPAQPTD